MQNLKQSQEISKLRELLKTTIELTKKHTDYPTSRIMKLAVKQFRQEHEDD